MHIDLSVFLSYAGSATNAKYRSITEIISPLGGISITAILTFSDLKQRWPCVQKFRHDHFQRTGTALNTGWVFKIMTFRQKPAGKRSYTLH